MVQLQFRIAIEQGKLIILSETLVDHLVDEKELGVSRGLEKIFLQASKKAAAISGMDLTVMQDPRNLTPRADGTTVESTLTSDKVENDRPKACPPRHHEIYSDNPQWIFCPFCGERLSS